MASTTPTSHEQLFTRGVAEIIDEKHLKLRIGRNRKLRIKYGIDPTSPHIHLGHAVPLRKLREWQDAGHQAVVVIGDYTAQVGDPTGRDKQRVALSRDAIKRNVASYKEQVVKILDPKKTEFLYNSSWHNKLSPKEFFGLLRDTSLQQLLAHETFKQRLAHEQPLSMLELIYPILQAYDSVEIQADVELGGIDQKFNLLFGRELQSRFDQEPQDIMLMPYLVGTDGKQKMSKSLGNTINLEDPPTEMFGKVMSIPDAALPAYAELAANYSTQATKELKTRLRKKSVNPRDEKHAVALAIVSLYYGPAAAEQAGQEFIRVFRHKQAPSRTQKIIVTAGQHQLINLLVSHQLAASRTTARRLIEQGAIKVDKKTVTDWETSIIARPGTLIQVGKKTFVTLELE